MTYGELIDKLKAKEHIKSREIPGTWFFYLLQDGAIKTVAYKGNSYEVNFIPSKPVSSGLFIIDDKLCKTGFDAMNMFETIVRGIIDDGLHLFITLDEEYFEIILEKLESNE